MDILLNWFVQGGLIGLAAAATLRLIPRSRTHARYRFAWAACVIVLALPAVPHVAPGPAYTAVDALGPVVSMPSTWWTSIDLALLLSIIWFAVAASRLGLAAAALRKSKRRCRACPPEVEARLANWSRVKASGRRARLALSTNVRSAAVLGWGSPVIALAPTLLDQLDDANLDRVVVHEWAHVQRRDDVALIVQRVVQLVAGWHPAVWWLTRQLELEREVACDALAISVTGSHRDYAACLVTLAALPSAGHRPLPVLAAASSGLRRRIDRILTPRPPAPSRHRRVLELAATVATAALSLAVGNLQIVERATASFALALARPTAAGPIAPYASGVTRAIVRSAPPAGRATRGRLPVERTNNIYSRPPVGWLAESRAEAPFEHTAPLVESQNAGARAAATEAQLAIDTSVRPHIDASLAPSVADRRPGAVEPPPSPWTAAANAGAAVGRRSQNAGAATASFFSRFGKKISASF